MSFYKLANFAISELASGITDSATTLTVKTGEGALFPSAGDFMLVVAVGATDTSEESNIEIMKCTARSTDTLTVVRAQEGTSAVAHAAAELVALRVTKGVMEEIQPRHADETVTVGSGGDYATINEAIAYLTKKRPLYKSGGYTAEISLLAGFTAAEQVFVKGVDLGWIKITSAETVKSITAFASGGAGFTTVTIAGHGYANGDVVRISETTNYNGAWNVSAVDTNTFKIDTDYVADDATGDCKRATNIDRSALTETSTMIVPVDSPAPYFMEGTDYATLPKLDVLFNMDTSGAANSQCGIAVQRHSRALFADYAGLVNSTHYGLVVCQTSYAAGLSTYLKGAGDRAIYVLMASKAYLDKADVSGSGIGAAIDSASEANLNRITADNCTEFGLYITGCSRVQANNVGGVGSVKGCSGAAGAITVANGAVVHCRGIDLSDAATYAIYAHSIAVVNALESNLDNAGTASVYAREGCSINLTDATNVASYTILEGSQVVKPDGTLQIQGDNVGGASKSRAYRNGNWSLTSGVWLRVPLNASNFDVQSELDVTSKTGTATATTSNKLVDSTKNQFTSADVGKWVYNSTDHTYAKVTAYDSASMLTLDTNIMASGENYELYAGAFTATVEGYYAVMGVVRCNKTVADKWYFAGIAKNGDVISSGGWQSSVGDGSATNCISGVVSDVVFLEVGDEVTLEAYHNVGSVNEFRGATDQTYLAIHRLS